MGEEIISSDRLLKKEENSGIASGEEVKNTDNGNAEWPSELQRDFDDIERQADIELTAEFIDGQLGKMPNWKSPGPDGLHEMILADDSLLNERKNFISAE